MLKENIPIGTYLDTNSPSGDFSKNTLPKALFKKSRFFAGFQIGFFIFLMVYARFAHAGLFADIWKFFTNSPSETETQSSAAAVSTPLLGSQPVAPANQFGVGGPADTIPLPVVQDSALIASRNPAGTLPSSYRDQIHVYTVQAGDTPGAIAENFGISLNTLLWANNIRNANLIKIGDELVILPVTGVQYEIKRGDTIEAIAKKFKGDAGDILSFNGLAIGEPIKVGEVIIIPDGEFTPPPAPSSGTARFASLPSVPGYYLRPVTAGRKTQGIHGYNGIDLAQYCGAPVLASAGGNVIISRTAGWNGGYGRYVVISHPNRTQTLYAHLDSVSVVAGQFAAQGTQIGTMGKTGNSTGCHVHFEIRGARNPF